MNRRPVATVSASSAAARLSAALEAYLAAMRAGTPLDRAALLAEHSDIADELAECLAGLDFVESAVGEIVPSVGRARAAGGVEPATVLGDFRIVREVGRGGMGIVYEAQQVSLGRRVALKVLPFAGAIDARQIRRFQVEAQAAGHLHHPHIVPVFAVGSERGVHFYAMQFIEGPTLATLIEEARGARPMKTADTCTETLSAEPSSSRVQASPSSRSGRAAFLAMARLAEQAAEALDHAHGLGVVHRDIKPANLIVDTLGELWVTDFGLARFHEDPGLTRSGDLLGTLRYMSPEQASAGRAVVDHRTDLYSLGATLYEAATLRHAFDGRDRNELLRQVTSEEPVPPRKVAPAIPRDLETIILKAMEKAPDARYQTARELADDLRRLRLDEPIRARRPTPTQHAVKWIRRHRVALAAAASALLVATTAAAGLLWVERGKTLSALNQAEHLRSRERAVLPRIFMDANALILQAMEKVGRSAAPADEPFYRMALDYYGGIIELTSDDADPRMREIAAKALFGQGLARMILREPGAEEALDGSARAYGGLARSNPGRPDLRFQQAISIKYRASLVRFTRGMAAAAPLLDEALAIYRDLAAGHPEDESYRQSFADELVEAAEAMAEAGDRAGSEARFREAIDVVPGRFESYNGLAWLLASRPDLTPHDPARALVAARRAVAIAPKNPAAANTLAVALFRNGDWHAADRAFAASMAMNKGGDPGDWFFLAMIHAHRGESEAARRRYDQAITWMTEHASTSPDLAEFRREAARALGVDGGPAPRPGSAAAPKGPRP